MSEIKFICPHCAQHIACEDIYCGEGINCPSCQGKMYVPPLAALIPSLAGNIPVMLPVASAGRRYPRPAGVEGWSEDQWEQHASELGVIQKSKLLPLWILAILPFPVAYALMMHRGDIGSIGFLFLLCALAAGFYFAKVQKKSGGGMVVAGLLYSFTALFVYMILAMGLLFIGCVAVMA